MSARQHQRLLENAYYAGVLDALNLNNGFDENMRVFNAILPYYDAETDTPPTFLAEHAGWEDLWHYLSERSYGLQYKALILNAHYAGTLESVSPADVLRGDWDELTAASDLPTLPSLPFPFNNQLL